MVSLLRRRGRVLPAQMTVWEQQGVVAGVGGEVWRSRALLPRLWAPTAAEHRAPPLHRPDIGAQLPCLLLWCLCFPGAPVSLLLVSSVTSVLKGS